MARLCARMRCCLRGPPQSGGTCRSKFSNVGNAHRAFAKADGSSRGPLYGIRAADDGRVSVRPQNKVHPEARQIRHHGFSHAT